MDWGQYFNAETFHALAIPGLIGLAVIVVAYFLRTALYRYIHKLALKTTTSLDDIMIADTRIASLLWCIWLGIWAGYAIASTPEAWIPVESKIIPIIFSSFAI